MKSNSNSKLPDNKLIEIFLDDDLDAFNTLYERYRRQMYAYLNRVVPGQHALIDDIFQQTWIKVIHQLPKYRSENKFLAWIMRIAHNLAIDYFRKSKHEILQEDTEEKMLFSSKDDEPWRQLDSEELGELLEKCINKLPPEQREVFLLRQDELSFKEITEIQNCSINTVLGRMHYATQNLRHQLAEYREDIT